MFREIIGSAIDSATRFVNNIRNRGLSPRERILLASATVAAVAAIVKYSMGEAVDQETVATQVGDELGLTGSDKDLATTAITSVVTAAGAIWAGLQQQNKAEQESDSLQNRVIFDGGDKTRQRRRGDSWITERLPVTPEDLDFGRSYTEEVFVSGGKTYLRETLEGVSSWVNEMTPEALGEYYDSLKSAPEVPMYGHGGSGGFVRGDQPFVTTESFVSDGRPYLRKTIQGVSSWVEEGMPEIPEDHYAADRSQRKFVSDGHAYVEHAIRGVSSWVAREDAEPPTATPSKAHRIDKGNIKT